MSMSRKEATGLAHRQAATQAVARRAPLEAESLADEFRARIIREGLAGGTRLGREQDLILQSGRSRATVREALRLLADQGLVYTRPGPKGGIFTATPGPDHVARSLGILLQTSRVALAELLEARVEIEAAAASIAAVRRTPEDLVQMDESCARLAALAQSGDSDAAVEENLAFHSALVAASHNTVLAVLQGAIRDLVRVSTVEPTYTRAVESEVARAHGRIVDALRRHDAAAAGRRVRRHLMAFEEYLRATDQYALLRQRFRF